MSVDTVIALSAMATATTTVALAWFTARYVRLTSDLVFQAKAAREPSIFIDFELAIGDEVILIVGNAGPTTAHSITFVIDDNVPWQQSLWKRPTELPAFAKGIPHLAPGRRLRYRVGYIDWKTAVAEARQFNITAKYYGSAPEQLEQSSSIDFGRYSGISVDTFETSDLRIAEAVETLARAAEEKSRRRATEATRGRWCHACAGKIPSSAKKCFRCGEWLTKSGQKQELPPNDVETDS